MEKEIGLILKLRKGLGILPPLTEIRNRGTEEDKGNSLIRQENSGI